MVERQRVMAKVKKVLSQLIPFTCNLWNAIFLSLEYFLLSISDPWSGSPTHSDSKENEGHSSFSRPKDSYGNRLFVVIFCHIVLTTDFLPCVPRGF